MNNGWIGEISQLLHVLRLAGADEDGGIIKYTGSIALFMGVGPDVVVDDTAKCYINGVETSILSLLKPTSYGRFITVINTMPEAHR